MNHISASVLLGCGLAAVILGSIVYTPVGTFLQEPAKSAVVTDEVAQSPSRYLPDTVGGGEILRQIGTDEINVVRWLQGPEVDFSQLNSSITVIDIWSQFCVPCHRTAGELVALQKEYEQKGVQFIGLTSETYDAESYLKTHGIGWPNAIVDVPTITLLKSAMTSSTTPDIRTTMALVVDAQGQVLWNDDAKRWRHQEVGWTAALREQLDALLAEQAQGSVQEASQMPRADEG